MWPQQHEYMPAYHAGPPGFVPVPAPAPAPVFHYQVPAYLPVSVDIPVPPKPEGPHPFELDKEAVAPSVVVLTGVSKWMTEDKLSQMVSEDNKGFIACYLYNSCTCQTCAQPQTHDRTCICVPCSNPMHGTLAVFTFKNPIAAEFGWKLIQWQILRYFRDLGWHPQDLLLQHPHNGMMLSHDGRRAMQHARTIPDVPPPPPDPENDDKSYEIPTWGNSKFSKRWNDLVESGVLSNKRKRDSSEESEAVLETDTIEIANGNIDTQETVGPPGLEVPASIQSLDGLQENKEPQGNKEPQEIQEPSSAQQNGTNQVKKEILDEPLGIHGVVINKSDESEQAPNLDGPPGIK